jgi:osmotically-inducible protein OsmY
MNAQVLANVMAAFENEPRVNPHKNRIHLDHRNGVLTLEGEVSDIVVKRLAPHLAESVPGVVKVENRLRVAPAEARGDGAIMDSLQRFVLSEPVFRNCTIRVMEKGESRTLQSITDESAGWIEFSTQDGTISLLGEVISLSHMRMAELLAWWTPGCQDVINSIRVLPTEEDTDAEVTDALLLGLEKDPLVQAEQTHVSTQDHVVTLDGYVRTEEERRMAERDAWYIPGVRDVVNRIEVRR